MKLRTMNIRICDVSFKSDSAMQLTTYGTAVGVLILNFSSLGGASEAAFLKHISSSAGFDQPTSGMAFQHAIRYIMNAHSA